MTAAPMRTGFGDVEVVPQRLHGYVRDLDARLYVPVGAPTSALVVYLHEGGFVGGDLDTAHAAADAAARAYT